MVTRAEQPAQWHTSRRFPRSPFSSDASVVRNRALFIDHCSLAIERSADDSGNRIEEVTVAAGSTTPVTTYYLVDVNNPSGYAQPIEQSATPGSPQITYVWGAQLISETYATGATIPGVGTASSPTAYYLLQDAHGSTRIVTDATGKVVEDMNYDAFGNAIGFDASTALTTYLYSSMPFDAASGNYYDHARYFDTGTGEFTQSDYGYSGSRANPMTGLPYAFTGGDPINLSDLNGHDFSLPSLSISVSIMAGLNGILGAALGVRNGVWGAIGGLVGGIDSTYISIYGSFAFPPFISFGVGSAVGAASELGITHGYSYLKTTKAIFTICLAGVVGSAIGYVAGAETVEIAESLGQSILGRAGMYQIVENAFRNTSEIEQAGLRNMVVFAVQHPLDTIGVFNKAVTGALSEAAVDALKVFAANSAVTLTDEVANYLVDEAQKVLQGLSNVAKLSQSGAP